MSNAINGLNVGYVYVLRNRAIPEYLKVGMTTRDSKERAKALSTTGVPGKWEVAFEVYVPDCAVVEKQVHRDLSKYRDSADREFFKLSLTETKSAVEKKAQENINRYPGWPDPQSVRNHLDRVELEKQQQVFKKQTQIKQREIEKKVKEADAEKKRLTQLDAATRETINSGLVSKNFLILFSMFSAFILVIDNGKDFSGFQLSLFGIMFGLGVFLRSDEKKDARRLREKHGFPPI